MAYMVHSNEYFFEEEARSNKIGLFCFVIIMNKAVDKNSSNSKSIYIDKMLIHPYYLIIIIKIAEDRESN